MWEDAVNSGDEVKPQKQAERAKKVLPEGEERTKKPRKAKEVNNQGMIKTGNKLVGSIPNSALYDMEEKDMPREDYQDY